MEGHYYFWKQLSKILFPLRSKMNIVNIKKSSIDIQTSLYITEGKVKY